MLPRPAIIRFSFHHLKPSDWANEMTVCDVRRALATSVIVCVLASPTAAAEPAAVPKPVPVDRVITITLVGDTGFSPNHAPVNSRGVTRHGRFQTWAQTTEAIAGEINGDLNFLNIETVVTDRNGLSRDTKGQRGPFNFRTHPNGLRHLIDRGFNVISLANNHSMDYGVAGLKESLRHVAQLKANGLHAAAGIGMNREEASRPQQISVKGSRIAYSAIGIVTNNLARHRAGNNRPGQIAYRFDDDFKLVVDRLTKAEGDYRMLSIHYGIEGRVRADARQFKEWRDSAALENGIDLIVGHHAHVPRGVEVAGKSVIFYGLGNFLHHGTADMTRKGICKDYGLLARLHLVRGADRRLQARAIEVVPLTQTHRRPAPIRGANGQARIHALNYLGTTLGRRDGTSTGVRFLPRKDGSGLYCFPGAANEKNSIGRLCRNWRRPPAVPAALKGRISASCSR